jgi:uroporphyrinogen decarboxylase
MLYKAIETPGGTLRMAARKTEDWQVKTLPMVSDHLWSRGIEFLIKGPEDLEKVRYLFYDPFQTDLAGFYESARMIKNFAAKHDVLVEGDVNAASNIALSLRGPTNLMCDAAEHSGMVDELLDIIAGWNLRRLELILDAGVDTVYHTGCYETTAFWSPDMYRTYFRPIVQKKIDMIHQAGARLHYYMDLGVMPLIHDFREMGIDILSTIDPMPHGDTDIETVKREVGDRICLWGGVDAPHTIERGTPDEVRNAVRHAIRCAAPGGGFVLSTADSIFDASCGDNVMAFISAGLDSGGYPISV